MRRRAPNRYSCINYPSRVEGWLDFFETEGQSTRSSKVPWGPLYCVLQQDEQTLTSYCSEELSLTDVLFAELPRVRLDQPPKQQMNTIWEGSHPTLQEEPDEESEQHHIHQNTSLRSALGESVHPIVSFSIFLSISEEAYAPRVATPTIYPLIESMWGIFM